MASIGIITPVKNEADNLEQLKESVLAQNVNVNSWIIVDDGSTDGSKEMVREFASNIDFIEAASISDPNPEYDIYGVGRVIRQGYKELKNTTDPDYIMNLDADMRLTNGYIAELIQYLESNPNCKVISGGIYYRENHQLILEKRRENQPAGGATVYPVKFLERIGGPPAYALWDSIIKAYAQIEGGDCLYLSKSSEKAIQSRETGLKGNQFQSGHQRGEAAHFVNYHPVVLLAKSLDKMLNGNIAFSVGYLSGFSKQYMYGGEQIPDEAIREYFYQEKYDRLQNILASKII